MKEKLKNYIIKIIEEYLTPKYINNEMPVGYNPIEKIRGSLLCWISVPFNGKMILCQLRCPNAIQISTCGDISNIIDEKIKPNKELTIDEIITIRNYQEELCKITFNIPTFDNIFELVGKKDFNISDKRKEFEAIKEKFKNERDNLTTEEKNNLSASIKKLELQLGFILPDDTMGFITQWATGNDVSDIKRINRDNFLRAAALAKAHNKAPSDYLSGVFTDYNKIEIDSYAFMVLDEFTKDQETVNKSKGKFRFISGNKTATNYKAD